VGVGGNGDVRGRDHIDDLRGIDVVISRHRAAMTGGHPTVKSLAHRLQGEVFEAAGVGVVGVVDQHVDVEIVLLGKIEADVDVRSRVRVGVFVPGQPADHVAALFERLVEQFGGARIAHDSFLREGDDLDIAKARVFLAHEQQSLRGAQAANRSDIGEQAEERRSILDPGLDHAPGALRHLPRVVFALEVIGDLDRLRQRARYVRPHDFAEQRLVGMQMKVDEARNDQVARRVDGLRSRCREVRSDGRNPSLLDADIDELLAATQPSIADEKIHGFSVLPRHPDRQRRAAIGLHCHVHSRMCRPRVRSMR